MKFYRIYNRFLLAVHYQSFIFSGVKNVEKSAKKLVPGIAELKISRTFALPFEKRAADEAESSYGRLRHENKKLKIFAKKFGGLKIMLTFAAPFEKRETEKFIEKTDYCTRSKYRENTIYREALILLKELEVSVTS